MFTVQDIRNEFNRLDKICGVNTKSIPIRISTRSTKQRGLCRHGNDRTVDYISISDFVLEEDAESFYNTVRHEYAHALVCLRDPFSNHGHDAVWKAACEEVGCSGDRTTTATPQQIEKKKAAAKYELICNTCGKSWYYQRKTKVIKTMLTTDQMSAICPRCNKSVFRLRFF